MPLHWATRACGGTGGNRTPALPVKSRLLFLLSAACLNQPIDVPAALQMLNSHATSYGDSVAILSLRVDLRTSRTSPCETVKAKLLALK